MSEVPLYYQSRNDAVLSSERARSLPGREPLFNKLCSGSVAGSYLRLIDFLSLNSRLESNKEEKELSDTTNTHQKAR